MTLLTFTVTGLTYISYETVLALQIGDLCRVGVDSWDRL